MIEKCVPIPTRSRTCLPQRTKCSRKSNFAWPTPWARGRRYYAGRHARGRSGAESIDFLDIVFRLEKAFDIKIPRGELLPQDILTDAAYVRDGRVTDPGLAELRKRMPFADLDEFAKNPVVQEFGNLLTVADMCRFVEGKLETRTNNILKVLAWRPVSIDHRPERGDTRGLRTSLRRRLP